MIGGKIENGLERGFVKHPLYPLLITDPQCFTFGPIVPKSYQWIDKGRLFKL